MKTRVYRPPIGYRLVLLLGWPTNGGMVLLLGLTAFLLARGGWLIYPGLLLAVIGAWGMWRSWNIRIVLEDDKIMFANQLADHVVPLDADTSLQLEPVWLIALYVPGVTITRNASSLTITASCALSPRDRKRLGSELASLSRQVGFKSTVPLGWAATIG